MLKRLNVFWGTEVAKFYGYVRAQVDPGRKGGKSLQAQRYDLDEFAERRGFSFDKIFSDESELTAESMMERKEGGLLFNVLQRDDMVVTPSLDRMFLNLNDARHVIQIFVEKGILLHLIDFGAAVEFSQLRATLSAIHAAGLERRSLYIRKGKKKQKLSGVFSGGTIPFGFALGPNGDLIEEPDEQRKIRLATAYRKKGLSWRNIARLLSQSGRKGRTVSNVTISRILTPKRS